jgi:erythromycin esterase-like protein
MKVKSIFLFLIFCSFAIPVLSQQRIKSYVQKNYKQIRTVDVLDSNYNDLEPIGKAIGDKRIVMLGEQDHGDVPTFFAKTRLIKYLHEKKGFNVLAFESDFFALNEGQKEIGNIEDFISYIQGNIFGIWTRCKACAELFNNYLPSQFASSNKITVTGFDSQTHGAYSTSKLSLFLDSVLTNNQWSINGDFSYIKGQLVMLADSMTKYWQSGNMDYGKLDTTLLYLNSIIDIYEKKHSNDFTILVLNSILATVRSLISYHKNDLWSSAIVRDEQMAKNLDWLVNTKYKNEKVMIWAASFHIANNINTIQIYSDTVKSMGTLFLKDPKNASQTYSIGFTSYTGTAGRLSNLLPVCKVQAPEKKSFENWFGKKDFAFIDFTDYNHLIKTPERFLMKPLGHADNIKAPWTTIFDGIFHIRKMYDCKTYNK